MVEFGGWYPVVVSLFDFWWTNRDTRCNSFVMGEWKSTRVTNLVRRHGRAYYAQVKIAGKVYRRSLETVKLDIAKIKLPIVLMEVRASAGAPKGDDLGRLRGALEMWHAGQLVRPELKESSKRYNTRLTVTLRETLPLDAAVDGFGPGEAAAWWAVVAGKYHATYANNTLGWLKHVLEVQVEAGHRMVNPAAKLKRMKIIREHRELPSPEDFAKVVADIRVRGKVHGMESADWIEFAAYTGMRPAEVEGVEWKDVGEDTITVRGGPEGTKNRRQRVVPIMAPLRAILERRRQPDGPVFYIKKPRYALRNACERLGIEHLRVYDTRHVFATRCVECGISFAVVAEWMGHTDGGSLLAKTYSHIRIAHSLEQAKRVEF